MLVGGRLHTITFTQNRKESDLKWTKIRSTSCQRKCTKKWSKMEWVDGDNSLLPEIKVLRHTSPTLNVPLWCAAPAELCLCKLSSSHSARPHSMARQTSNRRSQRRANFFFVVVRVTWRLTAWTEIYFCLFVLIQYANDAWLIKSVWVPNVQMAQRWKQQEFRLAFACRNLRRNRFTSSTNQKHDKNEWMNGIYGENFDCTLTVWKFVV